MNLKLRKKVKKNKKFSHLIDFNNTKQAKKKKQDYVNYFNVPVFFFFLKI
jgi:hypothetical protein